MNIRKQLPLEQQFELQVFESHIRQLSQEESHELLIDLKASMLHQATSFRKLLQEQFGMSRDGDVASNLLPRD